MKKWALIFILFIISYVILSNNILIKNKDRALAFIRTSLTYDNEIEVLRAENQALNIKLLNSQIGNKLVSEIDGINAKVFSIYPFADRSKIVLNVGENQGVKINNAVVKQNMLIGRIVEVRQNTSIAQTIFDSKFQIPVRIGELEIDALYIGSAIPSLNMIDSMNLPQYQDIVISAHPELPYGLGIGEIIEVSDGLLKEASIRPFIDIKKLRNVFIVSN